MSTPPTASRAPGAAARPLTATTAAATTATTTATTLLYRYPRLLALGLCLITVAGLSGIYLLPLREDPELTGRYALVKTQLSGSSAERVEVLVTDKIESALREVSEIRLVESNSRTGFSLLTVELHDSVSAQQVKEVWSRIRDKLRDVEPRLPPEASPPQLDELTITAYTLLVAVSADEDAFDGEGL